MILKELIISIGYDAVWDVLDREYKFKQGAYEAYRMAFEELKSLETRPNQSSMKIVIAKVEDRFEPGEWIFDVFGYKDGDKNHYALEMIPWDEWIGFNVLEKSVEMYGSAEVVAHALYEMTFFGISAETAARRIAEEKKILNERYLEVETGAVECFSAEDIIAELGIVDKRTKEEKEKQLDEFNRIQYENEKVYKQLLL